MINQMEMHALSEVINFVEGQQNSGIVLYRGQSNETWQLLPKIARIKDGQCSLDEEHSLFIEFKKAAHCRISVHPENELGWLALAQHHGLPTRLLDWSLNPLVALWFAISKVNSPVNGALWVYRPESSFIVNPVKIENEPDPFSVDRVKVLYPYHTVPRIENQSSVFTIHPRNPNHEFSALDDLRVHSSKLTKIVIPNNKFRSLMESLDCIGIHAANIMPDLDGLALRISSRFH
jgi:hypothetical protein